MKRRSANWFRSRWALATAILTATAVGVAWFAWPSSQPPLGGYLVGFDNRGIAILRLRDGAKRYLVENSGSTWLTASAVDGRSLFYVNSRGGSKLLRLDGGTRTSVVYTAPTGMEIHQIAVVGSRIVLVVDDRLVAIDRTSGKTSDLGAGYFRTQRIVAVGTDEVLVARDHMNPCMVKVNLNSANISKVREFKGLSLFFMSPDGKAMLLAEDQGSFRTIDVRTGNTQLTHVDSLAQPIALVDDRRALLWRDRCAMLPLGTFVVDLTDGDADKVCRARLYASYYLQESTSADWLYSQATP